MKHKTENYEVIVVGAGHAGCEAALASARMNRKTLLITINLEKVALMPCNPSVGGIGKGHLVKEIDSLGGEIGRNTDKATIQVKVLNKKKGPAVQAIRAQTDKKQYETIMRHTLENQPNLDLVQGIVTDLIIEKGKFKGVKTNDNRPFYAPTCVIATGTFLRGKVVIGQIRFPAGRMGEYPALELSKALTQAGLRIDRFQSATPPRIHRRSVDISKTTIQPGDDDCPVFSIRTKHKKYKQIPCYLTYTNRKTHSIVKKYLHLSPIRTGSVTGHGPRNCPSIDRKVINFPEKDSHPVFIEPEGRETEEFYLQGLTTSMPVEIQEKIIKATPGLENAELIRPGYAIEYDYLFPEQLKLSLETKPVEGLFTAGQINGTSGYEEAAAQGLIAGINAALKARGEEPFILERSQAYIGVLIDDLVTKGIDEPYRMFTSRAEHRLLLRSDNTELRLSPLGKRLGLISERLYQKIEEKESSAKKLIDILNKNKISPNANINNWLKHKKSQPINNNMKLSDILKRPEIKLTDISELYPEINKYNDGIASLVETEIKYEGYINRQLEKANQQHKLDEIMIPEDIDYFKYTGISYQAREKLSTIRPRSIGQAARISGVSPADISVLQIYLEQKKRSDSETRRN